MSRSKISNPPTAFIYFLVVLSIAIWCFLFRNFLNATSLLQGDAFPYLGHLRFYLENMTRGVYPLWDPLREYGNVNEFFMRRIGEFNPLFWLVVVLNKIGFSFGVAHRLFLAFYFFLAVYGFYLLSRRFFRQQELALLSALIFLFSSLGARVFESFILFEVVPTIWFAYFIVALTQDPRRFFLLGLVFCLMIINITYIPFYFYTIMSAFAFCYLIVYLPCLRDVLGRFKAFARHNRSFVGMCAVLWFLSMGPGFLWFKASSQGEALSVQRHEGSAGPNVAAVAIDRVNEGGIRAHLILDRQFVHLDKLEIGDFYLPAVAFLFLMGMTWVKINRRLVLLFLFGGVMFLIGIADASWVHGFLFKHVPFFKYFRNIQFFLWLAVLPVFILFVVEGMRIFQEAAERPLIERRWLTAWVVLIHAAAVYFCVDFGTTGIAVYVVIFLSLMWMLCRLWGRGHPQVLLCVLWLAVIAQPVEVYYRLAQNYPPHIDNYRVFFYKFQYAYPLPCPAVAKRILEMRKEIPPGGNDVNFAVRWYDEALLHLDRKVFLNYMEAPFVLYDAVLPMDPANMDYKKIEQSMTFHNPAYVHGDIDRENPGVDTKVRILKQGDGDFEFVKFTADNLIVRTNFKERQFLVRTTNFHSGWRVFIDGKPARLWRVNVQSQGVWAPAGSHEIHWRFGEPWRGVLAWMYVFLYVGILASLGWMAWGLRSQNQR